MATPDKMDLRALNRATLARQMLLERSDATSARALDRLAGLQAQWPRPPHVALWSRVEGFRRDDLLELVHARRAVRSTLMRATLHLVSAKEFVVVRAALAPALARVTNGILGERMKSIDLPKLLADARSFFADGGRTFDDLRKRLTARHPGHADIRGMAYAIRLHLPLVQVPTTSSPWGWPAKATFTTAEAWLGKDVDDLDPAEGARELVTRYLAAFGPASARDFQTWSGFPNATSVFEELRPKLRTFRDEDGRELFDLPKSPRPGGDVPAPVRFLAEFDNVVLSHADRRRMVDLDHKKHIYTPNGLIPGMFTVDGFVAGTWKIERAKTKATLGVRPFAKLAKAYETALEKEGDALVRFAEPDAETFDVRFEKPYGGGTRAGARVRAAR